MVIKFPLRYICIFLGVCLCFYSFVPSFSNRRKLVLSSAQQEHVMILDPGHGGLDGGAVGVYGNKESEINLEICLKTKALCSLLGIPHAMTRTSETLIYPQNAESIADKKIADQNARIEFIRSIPNGIVYSIHQNAYPSPSVSGFQVLYGHNDSSEKLGQIIQQSYNDKLNATRRIATEIPNNIYLFRHIDGPAVLIECGFISNKQDSELLQTDSYQVKLATLFTAAHLQFINTI